MKQYHAIITIYFLITTFTCNGMEDRDNIPQEKILREITVLEEPRKAQYLKQDRAIIFGRKGCSIINPLTTQEIIKINDSYNTDFSCFTLHPDHKKIALSTDKNKKSINIYNIDTGNQEWNITEKNKIDGSAFSPLESAIFLIFNTYGSSNTYRSFNDINLGDRNSSGWSTIIKHNYTTNERTEIYNGPFLYPNIALHPTQNILCAGNEKGKIFLFALDNLKSKPKKITLKEWTSHYDYSNDGSFIVARGLGINIINTNRTDLSFTFSADFNKKSLCKIKLNANSTMLAILSTIKQMPQTARSLYTNFYVIEYYDIMAKKCIYSAEIGEEKNYGINHTDLSFSPDENELMIVVNGKCLMVPVPLEVKRPVFIYWILKNYQANNPDIPNDIVYYITNTYLNPR